MKLGKRCTTCGRDVSNDELIECEQCGNKLHGSCSEWEQTYECKRCGSELEIGAVEF